MSKWISLICIVGSSFSLFAQTDYFDKQNVVHFGFDFGLADPDTNNDYFDFLEDTTTFNSDDLDGFSFQFKISYQLNNQLALGGVIADFDEIQAGEDLDFIEDNGLPILSETQLDTTFVGFDVVYTPFGAGETFGTKGWAPKLFVPYLNFGAGFKSWELLTEGDFVIDRDAPNPSIVRADFLDDGTAFAMRFGLGARINLHKNFDLNFNYNWDVSEDSLGGSFDNFGDIDLSSRSYFAGFVFRI